MVIVVLRTQCCSFHILHTVGFISPVIKYGYVLFGSATLTVLPVMLVSLSYPQCRKHKSHHRHIKLQHSSQIIPGQHLLYAPS